MSLAPYAMEVARSQGRRHAEPAHPYRDDYHRDRDRIIHSRAFRRLEAKTQVFTRRFSDHFRNRLTHTLEVAQIARTIARALGLNEELCEALALVHDIGHPPFGHAGERKLDALMGAHGDVFDHNLHALRMVESFEQRYAAFPGLNLTFEVREGIVKHSRDYRPDAHPELAEYRLGERPPLEAQLIDLADEIAYNTADLDDGYEAKLLRPEMMRAEVPVFRSLLDQAVSRYPQAAEKLQFNEALKSLFDRLTSDLIEYTRSQLTANHVASLEAVRACPRRLVVFSPAVAEEKRVLQEFLNRRLYQHPQITEERERAVKMLEELFAFFVQQPERLPRAYAAQAKTQPAHRVACDYLAGMTDTYVFRVHRDLLGRAKSQPASPSAPVSGGANRGILREHQVITLGVDLAASAEQTAICKIEWSNGKAVANEATCGVDDNQLFALIAQVEVGKVGIDVPFGWPDEFVKAVVCHKNRTPWPRAMQESLRFRETDRVAHEKTNRWPLSVSSDLIGVTAMRAASLFSRLAETGKAIDRTGTGQLVEVYPAAALKIWKFVSKGYKSTKGYEVRCALIREIENRTSRWFDFGRVRTLCEKSDDALDALVAALVARAAALDLCEPIPQETVPQAQREGWIALPKPDTLDKLA